MDRLGQILDEVPEVPRVDGDDTAPLTLSGAIELRGLRYGYGAGPTRHEVLHGVDLRIEPGEQVLIVGPIGAGKSTLVSLLPRLSEVPAGAVFFDGVDVRDLPVGALRRRIAFVPQEPFLFSMTIAENVAFGLDGVDAAQVDRALEIACLGGDVRRFADGVEARVGEGGVTLSGGQRQRMTVARAAAMEPDIWIFDDCMSAVDAGTEQEIVRGLRARAGRKTALFVTHRLLGFESVDRVVVLQEGRVVEQGDHASLMERGGWYAALYRRQKLESELAEGAA